jgi:hypothetical protein
MLFKVVTCRNRSQKNAPTKVSASRLPSCKKQFPTCELPRMGKGPVLLQYEGETANVSLMDLEGECNTVLPCGTDRPRTCVGPNAKYLTRLMIDPARG